VLAVVLALVSAAGYGVSDYVAGLATRAADVFPVTLVAQATSLVLALLVVPWVSPLRLSAGGAGWGAVAGVAGVFGAVTLYLGFRHAVFSVASTLSAVGAAALSVLAGLFSGERPSALVLTGIALAIVAIAAISAGPGKPGDAPDSPGGDAIDSDAPGRDAIGRAATGRHLAGVGYGLLSGACFALYFVAMDRAGSGSGLWPVIVGEAASLPVLAGCAALAGQLRLPPADSRSLAVATGATGVVGAICFFVASHLGLLAVTAVITSLYPGSTILLARVRLGERLSPMRLAGLALAGASVALIAIASAG
jgi:drug/metabolite transporter (DMT)-like permease